jgi:hypothetical protein
MKGISRSVSATVAALLLSGCIGLSFTEKKHETNRHVSIGKELIDLRTAYDEGLLNDEEYKAVRQQILKTDKMEETEKSANQKEKPDESE